MGKALCVGKSTSAEFCNAHHKVEEDKALATVYEGFIGIFTLAQFKGDKIITNTLQDPTMIHRRNAEDRKYDDERWNRSKEWKHVARVPLAQWLEWERLGITDDPKALVKAIELHKDEVKVTNRKL